MEAYWLSSRPAELAKFNSAIWLVKVTFFLALIERIKPFSMGSFHANPELKRFKLEFSEEYPDPRVTLKKTCKNPGDRGKSKPRFWRGELG